MKSVFVAVAIGAVLSACATTQKPFVFTTPAQSESSIDTVARVLAAEGQSPANVDRQLFLVQTEWKDTGFLYGQVQGVNATVVRRYTVTISPAASGSSVAVRIDAKRCPQGGFTVGGTEIRGTCEEAPLIPESMQKDLDALGAKISRALGAAPPAGGASGG
jgi:hypothetical protein